MQSFEELYSNNNCEQLVIIVPEKNDSSEAKIACYERKNTEWIQVFDKMDGKIGKNGVTENKVEGDMKTPIGVYSFGIFFGSGENLGFKFHYRKVDGNQFWVDDVESKYYNTWQYGTNKKDWKSAENLLHPAYKYAAVINYNSKCIKGKGSAIFFHKINNGATAGCIAAKEDELIKILRWLNPNKHPLIKIYRCEF